MSLLSGEYPRSAGASPGLTIPLAFLRDERGDEFCSSRGSCLREPGSFPSAIKEARHIVSIAPCGSNTRQYSETLKALGEVPEMTRNRRSPPAMPAGSRRSKALAARGARPHLPKLPKAKRRVQQNRGLEEALLKIAEIWHDAHTHRRSSPSKS